MRQARRHLFKRSIAKNNIRRHADSLRLLPAHASQFFKDSLIVIRSWRCFNSAPRPGIFIFDLGNVNARRRDAAVAIAAIFERILFIKIPKQKTPAAAVPITVLQNLFQFFPGLPLFRRIGNGVDKIFLLEFIGVGKQKDATGGQTVAAGAAGFLIISLDRLGQRVMDNETHVGLVNAHPKSDGRDHNIHFVANEAFLIFFSGFGVQPGMVSGGGKPVTLEIINQIFGVISGKTINDRALLFVFAQKRDDDSQ